MPNMNVEQMVEELSAWTVMDVASLVTALEEKWGVSAAPAAVAMAAGGAPAEAAEAQTEFDVELTEVTGKPIPVIKVVRELTGLGLGEAKALVTGAPKVLKEAVSKDDAEEMKKKLEEAGAKVTLK